MEEYLIPTKEAHAEFVERKSRFIGHIFPVETEEEALSQLKKMRETYWNATHNVYAYIIKDGPTRFSDDSEPQGTAGMPVLEVLKREGLYNVLCVATRYFGGILLGAGGLVRAYTKTAKVAVDAAGISMKRVWQNVTIPCAYNLFETLRGEVLACGGMVQDVEYGAEVTIHAIVPKTESQNLLARIVDVSNGRASAIALEEEYRAFPVKEPVERMEEE